MTYKLKPGGESVPDGVRRIARAEFDRIAEVVSDDTLTIARKVHEARKCTKRLRSLIRLIAPMFANAARENTVLRDAARSLSSARDCSALLESLARLKLSPEIRGSVEASLHTLTRPSAIGGTPAELLKAFAKDMKAAARRAEHWDISGAGFDLIQPGLKRSYRKLRRDFADALKTDEEEAKHCWRKSAKNHWHQTLLLSRICPDAMDGHARMAGRLSELLGDWRDTGLLLAALDELEATGLDESALKQVRRAAVRDQKRLLKKAEFMSRLLTAEKSDALTLRWAAYWSAAGK
ncbi:CHAD domain-containing protein [Hyphomonas sp. WL0036]|uniref:CHAD domain-containing protein n=1 Tax=Hyphomonas sediminis TaxID=2866160 RepID=UPI001C8214A9|nr:CHAD domain-containing protein [Hyphomonas sediminis]MBY9066213.1 CHAD domain-containing protein [Hyphomonas sediminis]